MNMGAGGGETTVRHFRILKLKKKKQKRSDSFAFRMCKIDDSTLQTPLGLHYR